MLCERAFGSAQEDTYSHLNGRLTLTLTWGLREADQLLVSRAGSSGRCNTLQHIDSIVIPRENRSVWLHLVKT
jgi:hypothetical protein